MRLTKEFIIEYLSNYYLQKNEIPKSKERIHPFCGKSVKNIFGSWNNALDAAKVPKRINPSKLVFCSECNKEFCKQVCQIKKSKSNNNFCSRSCSAKFNNRIIDRTLSEESKNKIRQKLQKSKKCINCDTIITGLRRKTCSKKCLDNISVIYGRKGGRKGGVASAAKQVRRSKGEIMFADLCIGYYGKENILCNENIFKDKNGNFWDADIIIENLKIAILYNGIWHYQQVRKNHNLLQVQTRDKLKHQIINDNGYQYYIVKDIGKFNKKFVQEQFDLFLHKQKFNTLLKTLKKN